MEKISRDAMRVDVPDVNPAGIDGTYIVKVRSSASAALWRYGAAGFASAELDREESTERGLTDWRKWHGQAWASLRRRRREVPSLLRASGLLVGQIDH